MRKTLPISICWFLMALVCWPQFYQGLSEDDKKHMAEAYYLVGARYTEVSEKVKGIEFKNMAFKINPDFDPKMIAETTKPKVVELSLLVEKGERVPLSSKEVENEVLVTSFFLRYVGAFFDEDTNKIEKLLDDHVFIKKLDTTISRNDAKRMFDKLFQEASQLAIPLSKLYNLDTVQIRLFEDNTFVLEINSLFDLTSKVVFWEFNQRFYIHESEGEWYIYAIGAQPVP